jgi:hypothetical protein
MRRLGSTARVARLNQMRELEKEIHHETQKKGAEFCYEIKKGTAHFTQAARIKHRRLRLGFHRYLLNSRFLVVITSPVIWMCAIPIFSCDVIGSIYQAICFPIYGIPRVRRGDYLAFDRHHLSYLNFFEKVNCEYCAYVNGVLAYFTEIAARTEQHWCPIKHAGCVKCAHSRYKHFVDFGDAEGYRNKVEEIRRSYGDLATSPGAAAAPGTKEGQDP